MNLRELEAQAEFLAPVIAAAVARAVAPLNLELTELRKCLADRPMPIEPEPVDLEALAQAAAALVVLPEMKDGKDAEPVDLEALAKAAAELVQIPAAIEPDLEAIAKLVEIPAPIPGKDAEPIDLEALAKAAAEFVQLPTIDIALLAAEAAKLVDVPEPIPGKDADPVDLQALARSAADLIVVPEVRQAEDGRDAIDVEILPAIEEAKQYPRGTYAAHRGGLWKSYERTHGMRGWECIVDGIDGVSITQDGDREFSIKLMKSSGQEVAQKFAMPIQIYKGVFREEQAYDAHDNVTWAGSQWTSTKAENTDKPGSSDAWQLTVKAGRNGKDLRENASTFDPAKGVKI
jgi:hypothetical protein